MVHGTSLLNAQHLERLEHRHIEGERGRGAGEEKKRRGKEKKKKRKEVKIAEEAGWGRSFLLLYFTGRIFCPLFRQIVPLPPDVAPLFRSGWNKSLRDLAPSETKSATKLTFSKSMK